jgi:hypothetical protein
VPILSNGPGDGARTVNLTLSNPSPNTTLGEGDTERPEIRESPAYTFTLIAQVDEGRFGFAFKAVASEGQQVLTGNGGPLTTIASTGDFGIAEFGGRFLIDSSGKVAFVATLDNEKTAIFRGDEESLSRIAITGGRLINLFDPAMSGSGNVVYAGQFSDIAQGRDIQLFTRGRLDDTRPRHRQRTLHQHRRPPGRERRGLRGVRRELGARAGIYSLDANGDPVILADDVDVATFTNVSLSHTATLSLVATVLPAGTYILSPGATRSRSPPRRPSSATSSCKGARPPARQPSAPRPPASPTARAR